MSDAGLIVLVTLISPKEADKQMTKEITGRFFSLVYVDALSEACEQREPEGVYEKRSGEIPNFTAIGAEFE